jgi:hypothetical protein
MAARRLKTHSSIWTHDHFCLFCWGAPPPATRRATRLLAETHSHVDAEDDSGGVRPRRIGRKIDAQVRGEPAEQSVTV